METGACYLVECRTGCTCCAYDNHIRGPFSSKVAAEAAIVQYRAMPLLASQYSRTGNYSIDAASYEQLSDGRLIINGNKVVIGFVDDYATSSEAEFEHTGY